MHSTEGYWKRIHKGATYVLFIIERLLPVFLKSPEARGLRSYQIPLPAREAELNKDLLELRAMKDVAILARSSPILDMWREKREAYCRIIFSKTCCERVILPPDKSGGFKGSVQRFIKHLGWGFKAQSLSRSCV